MSYRRGSAIAVALVLALLIVRTPASLVGYLLPSAVKATGFDGTLWNGEVAHVEIPLQGQPFAVGRITWALNPLGLVFGDLGRKSTRLNSSHRT